MESSDPSCGSLSEDLWIEIFKRSSVKSVCALRCVCKCWKSLISSDYFIHLHRTFNFSSTPANLKTYIRMNMRDQTDYTLFGPNLSRQYQLHFPLKSLVRGIRGGGDQQCIFIDVIHGVVCLSYGLESSFDSTILWNPAIHKYLFLPFLSFDYPKSDPIVDTLSVHQVRFRQHLIGFGYDIINNDFKVVRIWMPYFYIRRPCPYLPSRYEVYSSQRGIWKSAMLPDPLQSLDPLKSLSAITTGYFLNGSIHWFIQGCLLMFDCGREEFKTMELPREIQKAAYNDLYALTSIQLLEYAGMLAAWLPCKSYKYASELWVMEEHCTWKKLYKIPRTYELKELSDIHICQPSLVINPSPPYCLDEWIRFHPLKYCSRVYEESLLLMDHPNALSYTEEEADDYTDDEETDTDEECTNGEDSDIIDDHTDEDTKDS